MDGGTFYNPLKAVFDRVKVNKTEIDTNFVFLLHRKYTVIFLSVILACFHLYVLSSGGIIMNCISPSPGTVKHATFAIYCWTQGTFIIVDRLNGKIGVEVPYPGIGTMVSKTETVSYQATYGLLYPYFVYLFMVFQVPWWIWKVNLERGRLRNLLAELDFGFLKSETVSKRKKLIVAYFIVNLNYHQGYAFKYFVCELLNLFNVFLQMWLTDYILQGEFSTFGLEVLNIIQLEPENRVDPMQKIFPKVAKCIIKIVGPSGNIQPLDGICILPLNTLLEKMFVCLWFWYLLLVVCSCLGIIYRLLTVYTPTLRYWLLRMCSQADPKKLKQICHRCYYGDWFILFSLKNILDDWLVDEILEDLADKLEELGLD